MGYHVTIVRRGGEAPISVEQMRRAIESVDGLTWSTFDHETIHVNDDVGADATADLDHRRAGYGRFHLDQTEPAGLDALQRMAKTSLPRCMVVKKCSTSEVFR